MVTSPMFDGEVLATGELPRTSDVDTSGVLVRSRKDILQMLRQLLEQSARLSLSMAESQVRARGPLVYIDEGNNMLLVECADDGALELRAGHGAVIVACELDGAKIEFQSATVNVMDVDGVPVAGIELPDFLWRFQRRRSERHDTRALKITLNMGFIDADARVVNLGEGGVGVVCCGVDLHLAVGELLQACTISLPGVGEIRADLAVRHLTPARDEEGMPVTLAGCEFTGMSAHARSLMTRYLAGASGASDIPGA